jgi:hypothetical protein
MEGVVQNFYDLVKVSPVDKSEALLSFVTDFDLEPHLAEGREIDLVSLLGLNKTNN